MRKSVVLILFVLGFLPAKALADGISLSCTVTGTNAVTIKESPDKREEGDSATCKISGVALPSSAVVLDILENPSAPDLDDEKPVSDYITIAPDGNILLKSDSDDQGLDTRTGATDVGPEPLGFGPVVFLAGGTTYTLFSDVAPIPEPSTIMLFGSGLLALLARRKRH